MKSEHMRIGLALSGGGMRAAIFHLGVMQYLAEKGKLKQIAHISSVSGASIAIGLVYARSEHTFPTDLQYLSKTLPMIRKDITEKEIQWSAVLRWLISPYYWDKKVNLLAKVMEKKWKLTACLQDIPAHPLWTINTTAYETGKDFRISSLRMGSRNSFVMHPRIPLSHAMGASAGFPVLIGPYKLETKDYIWSDASGTMTVRPRDKVLHLWDGGVYDNMGLDPLFQFKGENQPRFDIDYLIVSNATAKDIEHKTRNVGYSIDNLKRLLDISMMQGERLRHNEVLDYMKDTKKGAFLQIGMSAKEWARHSTLNFSQKETLLHQCMSQSEVQQVAAYKTSLEKVSKEDFDRILRHGYETAMLQLHAFI